MFGNEYYRLFVTYLPKKRKIMTLRLRSISILVFFITATASMFAQDTLKVVDYASKKTYEIGGIEVKGAEQRDRNAIKSIAGLKVGQKISIPGPEISKGIKSLWKLRLFSDVQIVQTKTLGEVVFLEIQLKERPTLSRYSYKGVKKSKHDDLNDIVSSLISKESIVTEDQKNLCALRIADFFKGKGMLDTEVKVIEYKDEIKPNSIRLVFEVDTKERVKVEDITFEGNTVFSPRKLRKKMGNTKRKGTWFRKTKFVQTDYEEDKTNIILEYNKKGYRDAVISNDSIWRNDEGNINVHIDIDEGKQYFFRDIKWKGNSKYTDDQLRSILGIIKGDVYNPELLENRLRYSLDGRDVSSFYLDDGYLFFDIQPIEVSVQNDSIDIEMRIIEGPQATIENVSIAGNDRTNEHIIRRTLRTKPGKKFSRSDIIRSQREIINLGYFNPESLDIQTPVNPQRGTVDIKYIVEEQPSDQLELSAGYGGASGLIGTLGVTFNNFSVKNLKHKETWSPLPQGDGQKLSLRIQSNSQFYRSYNFSFTEPWLGGKRPNSFTLGAVYSDFDYSLLGAGKLSILRGFVGLGRQLKWPDDFFGSSTTLTLENIKLDRYTQGQFSVIEDNELIRISRGSYKNFSIRQVFTRSSVSEPIYPRRGSKLSLSVQFTPPYSLFRKDKYWLLDDEERAKRIAVENKIRGPRYLMDSSEEALFIKQEEAGEKFEWLEYHKWRFDGEWYFNLFGNVVLAANAKIGVVGSYNDDIGLSPFERFELGGDGLSNQTVGITGKDIIALRGYEVEDLDQNQLGGATVFDKFTMELRFPLSLNPSSTIYFTSFIQGGNVWGSFKDVNPFDMKRSAGSGMRVFLPMFGLLGFDYGFGFDKNLPPGTKWSQFGKFSIVLGFEPD